jgi:hypothetical protein
MLVRWLTRLQTMSFARTYLNEGSVATDGYLNATLEGAAECYSVGELGGSRCSALGRHRANQSPHETPVHRINEIMGGLRVKPCRAVLTNEALDESGSGTNSHTRDSYSRRIEHGIMQIAMATILGS